MTTFTNRRSMLGRLAQATGAIVLLPLSQACKRDEPKTFVERDKDKSSTKSAGDHSTSPTPLATSEGGKTVKGAVPEVPKVKGENWDSLSFNRLRGNAGAIPDSYLPEVNGPDGDREHVGKHLPYVPALEAKMVPVGYLAIMWGDPSKGHAEHPNAPPNPKEPQGHWYNWVRVRKATVEDALEVESVFDNWPAPTPKSTGKFAVQGGGDITAEEGKNTIYLVALPSDCRPGDTIRIWAHCLTHGEYVDFLTI